MSTISLHRSAINLNAYVTVQLTDFGKAVLRTDARNYAQRERPLVEDNQLRIQMWELMQIFGSHMFNGNPKPVFTDMNVTVEDLPFSSQKVEQEKTELIVQFRTRDSKYDNWTDYQGRVPDLDAGRKWVNDWNEREQGVLEYRMIERTTTETVII
jgi:hypothetical protein